MVQFSKVAVLILFVSYVQGLLYEFTNTFIWEWIYQNIPFENITLFKIPVVVLFGGWIFLLIMPFAIFELVLHLNKKKAGKSFFRHHQL